MLSYNKTPPPGQPSVWWLVTQQCANDVWHVLTCTELSIWCRWW